MTGMTTLAQQRADTNRAPEGQHTSPDCWQCLGGRLERARCPVCRRHDLAEELCCHVKELCGQLCRVYNIRELQNEIDRDFRETLQKQGSYI